MQTQLSRRPASQYAEVEDGTDAALGAGSAGDAHASQITVLAPQKLYALHNVMELAGRVSAYPATARGYAPSNCYLLKHDDRALLLDSGYTAHQRSLLRQIGSLLEPTDALSIFPMRINEYMSVCNVEAIAAAFDVEQCYSGNADAAKWVDFGGRSDAAPAAASAADTYALKTTLVGRAATLYVGRGENRPLQAFQAPIRLISTRWMFDAATRTLFTSDTFSHEWSQDQDGPWTTTAADNDTSAAHIRSFLLNTRYWWLEGGSTDALRRKLGDVFDKYDIETIAPGYGRILRGKDLVRRQYQMLDDVLRGLDKRMVQPKYVDRDEVR
ncbi:hypothetical protein [Bordetella sp. N]|uniref:hypothetical protein n=1 Tax=Bordetella sp. N TaxID=1746199 RepID=UPI00070F5B21|nr:hypothetical protein [Bordetella sp. N]ALM86176.1 hypothetical protein ASB57_27365 [Bordetella sp. N]